MRNDEAGPQGGPDGGVFTIRRRWYRRYDLLLLLLSALMLFAWPKLWRNLTASGYMPHGHCYFWIPELVALHLVSDVLIGLAYVSISATLTYLVYRARRDIPFHWVFLAFGLFIVACGLTHWMEVWTIWNATYWLSGYVKLVTAVASVATAVVLPPLVPRTLEMVRAAKLSEGRRVGLERAHEELQELREREGRLAEERIARLAAIVESSEDAIIGETLDGRITSWNRGAEKHYGYTAEEAVGRHIYIIVPAERRGEVRAFLEKAGRGEGVESFESVRVSKGGRVLDVSVTVSPVRDAAGNVVGASAIARDISGRKRAEREREELLAREHAARQRAEEASRLKEEFLATVSHELRTPLTAILGWAYMLEDPTSDPETVRHALSVIRRSAEEQRRIVEDILDMSGIVRGRFTIRPERVDLSEVARAALDTVRPAAEAKRVRLRVEAAPGVFVTGDPRRLQQVVWNLLSNALKFTPAGGEVRLAVSRDEGHARVEVTDTGVGIAPEFLPYVFDRFRQADSSTTRQYGGLGLGLSIVRHLVELHGGSVRAQSPGEGRGATLTVDLPPAGGAGSPAPGADAGAREGAGPAGRPRPAADSGSAPLAGRRVLLVDDDEYTLEALSLVLRRGGAEVVAVSSAAAALEVLGRLRPDVIVSDVGMPGEDGFELIGKVRASGAGAVRGTPAVALTAYAAEAERERALSRGFDAHLSKPVVPAELLDVIARLAGGGGGPS